MTDEAALADAREPRARALGAGRFALSGAWTAGRAGAVERAAAAVERAGGDVVLDVSGLERLDTLGAWVIERTLHDLRDAGASPRVEGAREEWAILLREVERKGFQPQPRARRSTLIDALADVGRAVAGSARAFADGIAFLGRLVVALLGVLTHPSRFRPAALVNQLELVAFRAVPIIALISFLVGCIIAQQSVFQLQTFGTVYLVADLIGILTLRELGVLLTSIMIAGRSGSAITAEIGSMKMREEIDAVQTMGLDPLEVLIAPRVLALVIGLPLLTFVASMSAILGGGVVAYVYGDVGPELFLSRLRAAVGMNTFLVGMIKAPFMALVIGVIASMEGMKVEGSAESLGRQTTSSVVKAIFMVIVVDGLFATFFAAIRY